MMISRLNASSLEKKKKKKHLCPNCRSMHLGKKTARKVRSRSSFYYRQDAATFRTCRWAVKYFTGFGQVQRIPLQRK